jgi:hypothetical protein
MGTLAPILTTFSLAENTSKIEKFTKDKLVDSLYSDKKLLMGECKIFSNRTENTDGINKKYT